MRKTRETEKKKAETGKEEIKTGSAEKKKIGDGGRKRRKRKGGREGKNSN
jgi:hypothetical protein